MRPLKKKHWRQGRLFDLRLQLRGSALKLNLFSEGKLVKLYFAMLECS